MAIKRIALVYQTGIANVFQVETFSNSPGGRNARRLLQDAFAPCEWFTRGMLNAGNCEIKIFSCNRAGDIASAPWADGLADCPFRDNAKPPKSAA